MPTIEAIADRAAEVDGAHPLDETSRDITPVLEMPFAVSAAYFYTVTLDFGDNSPDSVSLRCWPSDAWGSTGRPSETVTAQRQDNGTFRTELPQSDGIFAVDALWDGSSATYTFCTQAEGSEELHPSFDVLEELAVSDLFSVCLHRVEGKKRQNFEQKKRSRLVKEIRHLGKRDVLPARQILSVCPHDIGERYSRNVDLSRLDKDAQEINRPGKGLHGNEKIPFLSCDCRRIRHKAVPQAPPKREHRQGGHCLQ